jgi:hypothetical protein
VVVHDHPDDFATAMVSASIVGGFSHMVVTFDVWLSKDNEASVLIDDDENFARAVSYQSHLTRTTYLPIIDVPVLPVATMVVDYGIPVVHSKSKCIHTSTIWYCTAISKTVMS